MKSLIFALKFFTRIPAAKSVDWEAETAARSLGFLPLTGLITGFFLSVLYCGMLYAGWPQNPYLQAALLLLAEAGIGGFLFTDGFADSCDGLFSQNGREKTLAIMQDSRLGTLGVIGLIFYFSIKMFLLVELAAYIEVWRIIFFYPCWGRFCVTSGVYFFATAKNEGLAAFFKENMKFSFWLLAAGITAIGSIVVRIGWLSLPLSALIVLFAARQIEKTIGGQTGDTYGFLHCLGELSFLLFTSIIVS